jgi:hypothetical protein
VWNFAFHFTGWGLLGGNAYLIASLALLVALPLGFDRAAWWTGASQRLRAGFGPGQPERAADLDEFGGLAAGPVDGAGGPPPVREKAVGAS